jgi:hypothetical protein
MFIKTIVGNKSALLQNVTVERGSPQTVRHHRGNLVLDKPSCFFFVVKIPCTILSVSFTSRKFYQGCTLEVTSTHRNHVL